MMEDLGVLITSNATSIQEETWNDDVFRDSYLEPGRIYIPKWDTIDMETLNEAIRAFWAGYLLGSLPPSAANWFKICGYIMGASRLFQEVYEDLGTLDSSTIEVVEMPDQDQIQSAKTEGINYSNQQACSVISTYSWRRTDHLDDIQDKINYVCLHIAYMMRLHRKRPEEYLTSFKNRASLANANLVGGDVNSVPVPAGDEFLRKATNLFGTSVRSSCLFLAQLISCITVSGSDYPHSHKMKALLRAGCLVSLEKVGLGLFGWVLRASEALEKPPQTIMPYLHYNTTDASIQQLISWCRELRDDMGDQKTYGFARSMGDQYLIKLSTRRHPYLCYLLAYLTLGEEANNLTSMTLSAAMRGAAETIAETTREILTTPAEASAISDEAKKVLERIRRENEL